MHSRNPILACCLLTSAALLAGEQQLHSDFAQVDGKNGIVTYKGNARLFDENVAIASDEMVSKYNEKGEIEFTRLTGSPARLEHTDPVTGSKSFAEANEIVYRANIGRIELQGSVLLQQDDKTTHTRVSASKLVLQQQDKHISEMDAVGKPALFERQQNQEPMYQGQALNISYRDNGQLLKLEGEARLTQGSSILEHQIIIHDGVNRRTTLPKRDGVQNNIILRATPKTEPAKQHD